MTTRPPSIAAASANKGIFYVKDPLGALRQVSLAGAVWQNRANLDSRCLLQTASGVISEGPEPELMQNITANGESSHEIFPQVIVASGNEATDACSSNPASVPLPR